MSAKEENSAVTDLESDIDSMVSVLRSEAPRAPVIKEITKSEVVLIIFEAFRNNISK